MSDEPSVRVMLELRSAELTCQKKKYKLLETVKLIFHNIYTLCRVYFGEKAFVQDNLIFFLAIKLSRPNKPHKVPENFANIRLSGLFFS